MTFEYQRFIEIGQKIEEIELSQMFGKPCFKIGGKAFTCFYQNEMVFKLQGEYHIQALSLDGSQLFDPSGKGKAMKEWIQVSNIDYWEVFANAAVDYLKGN
jgi:hypothetical protein